jgi:hypothetical protein
VPSAAAAASRNAAYAAAAAASVAITSTNQADLIRQVTAQRRTSILWCQGEEDRLRWGNCNLVEGVKSGYKAMSSPLRRGLHANTAGLLPSACPSMHENALIKNEGPACCMPAQISNRDFYDPAEYIWYGRTRSMA